MNALYDRQARIVAIDIDSGRASEGVDSVDLVPRTVVVVDGRGAPLTLEIHDADLGVEEPIAAALRRWPELDREALVAASRSALAAPDREITLTIAAAA